MTIATRFPKSWAVARIDIKDPSLVLYIPFWYPDSETAGSPIISKDTNRHSATVTGATWGSQGRTFDGTDDYISVPDSAPLDITQAITLEVWFKTSSVTANSGLISKFGTTTYAYLMYIQTTGKVLEFAINGTTVKAGTTAVDDGKWHHGMLTYDRVNAIAYLDGIVEFTQANTAAINSTTDDVIIGSETTTYSFLNGTIGEVRIYSRALSVAEILHNYQVTKWRYV